MDFVLACSLVALPVLGTFAYAGVRGAPWVPTFAADVVRIRRVAALQPGERFFDLGCGDGRIVRAAADAGAHATGFECSLLPYVLAKFRVGRHGAVRFADFWSANLSDADVVYCYLMPKIYPKLKAKLERECRPGTRIILHVWPMSGWTPMMVDTVPGHPNVFLYQR